MSKKIEPTDAMILVAASTGVRLGTDIRAILRAALNHPDARGLFAGEDDRPWEPLSGPVRVGDEVRQDYEGFTITAVVARVDEGGDPWTAERALIGLLCYGTWYVRRAAQELPTEDGAVIIPAEGVSLIESVNPWADGADGVAMHHVLRLVGGLWIGDGLRGGIPAAFITPGTWQVVNQ